MSAERLRKKRLWNVRDFAEWIGIPRKSALALLKQLDKETGGMLLRTGSGKRPTYTFLVGALARAKPEIFERVASLEGRVEQLEEHMAERVRRERMLAVQTGENTREIAKMARRRAAA